MQTIIYRMVDCVIALALANRVENGIIGLQGPHGESDVLVQHCQDAPTRLVTVQDSHQLHQHTLRP